MLSLPMQRGRESMQDTQLPQPIRNYRDTIFRMLFREKKELLSLFNAVHGTGYENPEDLEITTLENAVYMSMKNDISCVLDMQLVLYEHQSTVNPNMPLRDLFYVSKLLEEMTRMRDIYAGKRIMLPVPQFIVLYNGREPQPERREFYLSESFAKRPDHPNLELVVVQLNINPGFNEELMNNCKTLGEYVQYTERVRQYSKELPLREAVEKAVRECIEEDILADFLRKNRTEVVSMSIFEYDEEKHMKTVRSEGFEDGFEQNQYQVVCRMLRDDLSAELISKYTGCSVEHINQIKNKILVES